MTRGRLGIILLACIGLVGCRANTELVGPDAAASPASTLASTRAPGILLPTQPRPTLTEQASEAEPSEPPPEADRIPVSFGIASENGRRIATLYNLVDRDVFVLEVFDSQTKEATIIYEGESTGYTGLFGFDLSPDGEWIAFIVSGVLPGHGSLIGAKVADLTARPPAGSGYTFGKVMIAPVADPKRIREIGFCGLDELSFQKNVGAGEICGSWIAWAPDSRALAWWDIRALWYADLDHYAVPLSNDDLRPRSWSPAGRYLMVDEGGQYRNSGVIDTMSGKWVAFRDAFPYPAAADLVVDWAWDGRLVLERTMNGGLRREYWRIDPLVDGWLVLDGAE